MFELAKRGTVVRLLRFSPSFLLACTASNRANLAFKTTIIEDTHLTLAGIQFKVEANNSLIFCHYKHTRKKVSVPVHIYNSLSLYMYVRELPALEVHSITPLLMILCKLISK